MRLFIALPIDEKQARFLAELQGRLPAFRGTKPKEHHLTLQFLGSVDEKMAERVKKELQDVTSEPMELTVDRMGTFPMRGKPRVVWAGFQKNQSMQFLLKLRMDIARKMRLLGFRAEQHRFHPHLTLARVKHVEKGSVFRGELLKIKVRHTKLALREFCLFESKLEAAGPVYRVLERYY